MSGASLPVPLGDLPGYVRDDICVVLDSSAEHNWVKLIEKIPDHGTYRDLLELRSLADRVSFSVMLLAIYLSTLLASQKLYGLFGLFAAMFS